MTYLIHDTDDSSANTTTCPRRRGAAFAVAADSRPAHSAGGEGHPWGLSVTLTVHHAGTGAQLAGSRAWTPSLTALRANAH
jgi:hypothetical protein